MTPTELEGIRASVAGRPVRFLDVPPAGEWPRQLAAEVVLNGTAYIGLIPWDGDPAELDVLCRGAVQMALNRSVEWP